MNAFSPVRGELRRLARLRTTSRRLSLLLAAASAVLGMLLVVGLLDWWFDLETPGRAMILAAASGGTIWLLLRNLRGARWRADTERDVALVVESRPAGLADLLAALEFSTSPPAYGASAALMGHVVHRIARVAQREDLSSGLVDAALRPRVALFAALGLIATTLAIGWPGHVAALLSRLSLNGTPYPSRTHILELRAAGQPIDMSIAKPLMRVPLGRSLEVSVFADGVLPTEGEIQMVGGEPRREARLPLESDPQRPGWYLGQLPPAATAGQWRVWLGDTRSAYIRLETIEPPVLTLELKPEPPSYAAQSVTTPPPGDRQMAVIEGTRVGLRINCLNKPLREALLRVGENRWPLTPADETRRQWTLEPLGTPLERIVRPVAITIEATDADGMNPTEPLSGLISVRPDQPPRVTAAMITHHVLPTGKPALQYAVDDDFGIGRIMLVRQVARQSGAVDEDKLVVPLASPGVAQARGQLAIDLTPLDLVKGDQVKLTLHAQDFRGPTGGRTTVSDPIVLYITDERGVLEAMAETDERSAKQLDAIIDRQLQLEGTR